MSGQPIDSRKFLQTIRRHRVAVALFAALGLLAGAGYTIVRPPMFTSEAFVVVSSPDLVANSGSGQAASGTDPIVATQLVVASSNPVLSRALRNIHPAISLQTLRNRVEAANVAGSDVISISAQGLTAAQAKETANAVTHSYVAYAPSAGPPRAHLRAEVLELAGDGIAPLRLLRLIETGAIGVVLGMLIGIVMAVSIGRRDRRLRARDDIADSIGIPILAAVSVRRPAGAAGWAKLFSDYEPGPVDAWRLRKALYHLGLADVRQGNGASVTVVSLSSDRKALALGPQLATFAASLGIPALLVVGPQQDPRDTAALRAACAEQPSSPRRSRRSRNLRLAVSDHNQAGRLPRAALTVVVAAVDGTDPRVDGTIRTAATVLGVSAGAATAEQLARVAANAAAGGHRIAAILVADPDPSDRTTGRLPQLVRPTQRRMPARITGTATETRW